MSISWCDCGAEDCRACCGPVQCAQCLYPQEPEQALSCATCGRESSECVDCGRVEWTWCSDDGRWQCGGCELGVESDEKQEETA